MSPDTADRSLGSFWIEEVATGLGLDRFSRWVTWSDTPQYGPVVLLALVTLIDVLVLSGVEVPRPGVYRIRNPGAPALVVGWPLVALIMLDLRRRYGAVIEKLPGPDEDIERPTEAVDTRFRRLLERAGLLGDGAETSFRPIVPTRLKLAVLAIAIGFHYVWLSTAPFDLPPVTGLAEWAELRVFIKFYVFVPATYYVAGAEFVSLVAAVHILVPFRVRKAGAIDFTDPQGYAGLRPVGRLVMRSSALFLVLVTVFAVFVSLPGGVTWDGTVPRLLLVSGSVFAVVLFVAPVFWIHRHMVALKEAKLDAIASRVQTVGPDEAIFPDTDFETSDDVMAYTHEYICLNRVENTAEYPVDVRMLQDLLAMFVLPYFTGYTSNLLFGLLR